MDLSAIIKAVLAPQTERGGQARLNLQPGDRLVGKVIQIESDGRVLIDLGRSRVLAQVGFAVKQGQALKLTVVENGPLLHLRADLPAGHPASPPAAHGNLPGALSTDEQQDLIRTIENILPRLATQGAPTEITRTMIHALRQIKAAFNPLPVEKSTVEIVQWLRNAVENHGGLFEKRLADIEKAASMPRMDHGSEAVRGSETPAQAIITRDVKPQLIVLKHFLEGGDASPSVTPRLDAKDVALLRSSVQKMLSHVELQQERAIIRSREGEPFQLFSHLLPMADRQPAVRLKVYYPRKDGQREFNASHRIAVLLDMDRLGMIRGDIAKVSDVLRVHFFVQDEDIRNYFKAQLSDIESALGDRFDQVCVDVSVSREKIAQFHEEDNLGVSPGRINIKA